MSDTSARRHETAYGEPIDLGATSIQVGYSPAKVNTSEIIALVPSCLSDLGRVGCIGVIGVAGVPFDLTVDKQGKVRVERPGEPVVSDVLPSGQKSVIGRARGNVGGSGLPATVSRNHAWLSNTGGELFIGDAGSLNGTWLTSAPLGCHEIKRSAGLKVAVAEKVVRNEDDYIADSARGVFAVFDGAGGEIGAQHASSQARKLLNAVLMRHTTSGLFCEELPSRAEKWLEATLNRVSGSLNNDSRAGLTTAVVARIVENENSKTLVWASIGDSRLYLVRDGVASQISHDEGYGNFITKALGMSGQTGMVEQLGQLPLFGGDRVLLVTDGITGDYEKDIVSFEEIGAWVSRASTPEEAASNLVDGSRKHDDGTALVVFIP